MISLIETRPSTEPSRELLYIALSYCWGDWAGLMTKKENLTRMMHSIPMDELPGAVRDAVLVCRKYGIRHLWIDALCICQDDPTEWSSEVSKMADIYGGCEFALSALSSHEASEGFLRERRFRPISVGSVRSSYGTWYDDARLFIRRRPRSINDEINFSSLSRRAWALQERLLAPAILHYGRDEVIWECNTDYMISELGR
jgi:Heterokaryon incompatibility protein (HET)